MTKELLTFLLLLTTVLWGCGHEETASRDKLSSSDSALKPDSELTGAQIFLYERGRVSTEIRSERIRRFEARDSAMAYVVNVDAFDTTGQITGNVVADSGIIREESGRMDLYGHVVLITKNKARLETDYLYWNSKTDKIETDAFVRITEGSEWMTGWGLIADQQLESYKLLRDIKGGMTGAKELSEP